VSTKELNVEVSEQPQPHSSTYAGNIITNVIKEQQKAKRCST